MAEHGDEELTGPRSVQTLPGARDGNGQASAHPPGAGDLETLRSLEKQILWLSVAMVHHANKVRPNSSGVKVGGHQASSASMASLMTALWFGDLRAEDRVSVKPHAGPVLHAINYLLGYLDEPYLETLRAFKGLQSYPSRTKDPDPVDYSTGSVGIGAAAPIWGGLARRYVDDHFGPCGPRGRQISLLGDAELDEGACWEALLDPLVSAMGEVLWVVDLNRQSLDRVVPAIAGEKYRRLFEAAGWQVITLKYGRRLRELFSRDGGEALHARIDSMPNPEYQRLLRVPAGEVRDRLPGTGPEAEDVARLVADLGDADLKAAIRDLGGHDLADLIDAYRRVDPERPTVILAWTIKGYGLPTEGHPSNHSALLDGSQFAELAARVGADPHRPWSHPAPGSDEDRLCRETAGRLRRPPVRPTEPPSPPKHTGRRHHGTNSTQAAFGRLLLDLSRSAPEVAARVVTVSPDVASSTNLGGWINKAGVYSGVARPDWFADDAQTLMHWKEHPGGQHVELGIAEVNLVGLLSELGATWSRWGQPLLPIGTIYDPFVNRALEPWIYGVYAGGQSILVGTPSGITLSGEGGAHQSVITPSVGLETPGVVAYEPAFTQDLEWCLLDALAHLGRPGGRSAYFRLTTRPVDQALARLPEQEAARDARRERALAGGYFLRTGADPQVTIAAMGAVIPEAVAAADDLACYGVDAAVVCVTSADLLYRANRHRAAMDTVDPWLLDELFPAGSGRPVVTVLDGHPHTLSFLGAITRGPSANLGVADFGQTGSVDQLYRHYGIDAETIAGAALDLVDAR
jgi:pyruvate dehydrogenase E1 component